MKSNQSLQQEFVFSKSNSQTYLLGFLKYKKVNAEENYYFSDFSRHALTDYLSVELGIYRIAQDKSYIIVKYELGIVEEIPIHEAKHVLLEILNLSEDEKIIDSERTFYINRDDILDKFLNVQTSYFSLASINILKALKKSFLRDEAEHSYFFYKNGLVKVSENGMELKPYEKIQDKLIFNKNELPKAVEQNDAFFRRLWIVPFVETIPEEERDSTLPNGIIKSELTGVFNIEWVDFGQPYFESDLFKAYLKLSPDLKCINPYQN